MKLINDSFLNAKFKIEGYKIFRKDWEVFGGSLLFYVNEKLICRSLEICLPDTFMEILPLELRFLNSKWLILVTYKPPSENKLMSLKFKNYLHIIDLHMIRFYFWETLICHFLMKIWRACVVYLNWIIPLNTQQVSKAQTSYVLIICILTKIQCFLIHLLSRLAFLTTIVWFVQCFARHFVKVPQNLYTAVLIKTIIKNTSKMF